MNYFNENLRRERKEGFDSGLNFLAAKRAGAEGRGTRRAAERVTARQKNHRHLLIEANLAK